MQTTPNEFLEFTRQELDEFIQRMVTRQARDADFDTTAIMNKADTQLSTTWARGLGRDEGTRARRSMSGRWVRNDYAAGGA
jgi:hypothetical protein